MKPFVIWDSTAWADENCCWREAYIEDCLNNDIELDERDITEEKILDFAIENNRSYLEDIRFSMETKEVKNGFFAIANIGLWNGRVLGYKEFGDNLSECLYTNCDDAKWYVDNYGRFCGTLYDHDGTTFVIYRMWRPWVSEEQKEMVLDKIYCGEVTERILKRYTLHMGKIVKETLGF